MATRIFDVPLQEIKSQPLEAIHIKDVSPFRESLSRSTETNHNF